VLATSHNETSLGYTVNTDSATLFTGNASCTLTPEVTQGPYYVAGEYVRRNIIEDQAGVDIVLDFQVVDVNTCNPVPDVYLEMWHCNSTGVYSGIVASGNGDSSDTTNIDKTWLRGIQATDSDGVAQFESIFPGHYTSRATHIHVLVHTNATKLSNDTLGATTTASHVGQTFFDQDLISLVETTAPYNTNTQELTTNAEDSILSEEADEGVDPVMDYTLLGDSVEDGIFAWIAFGIDGTSSYSVTPAATYYASGGVENESSGSGAGGSGGGSAPSGGAGGSAPTGSGAPTGSAPTSSSSSASVSATAVGKSCQKA
jgi:protocatechuate 3,4-dioxygenase beta subunit